MEVMGYIRVMGYIHVVGYYVLCTLCSECLCSMDYWVCTVHVCSTGLWVCTEYYLEVCHMSFLGMWL